MFTSRLLSSPPINLYCLLWLVLGLSYVAAKRPNILFILTDDQDGHMESIEHMPLLQKYIVDEGTVYENHFCTIGLTSTFSFPFLLLTTVGSNLLS